ncbi:MAG TPA: flagellar hook-length control protein FliK [Nitrospirae bacterium]|nr:flagellar hook-length control protein FliK [Nitrospirota bacterium]
MLLPSIDIGTAIPGGVRPKPLTAEGAAETASAVFSALIPLAAQNASGSAGGGAPATDPASVPIVGAPATDGKAQPLLVAGPADSGGETGGVVGSDIMVGAEKIPRGTLLGSGAEAHAASAGNQKNQKIEGLAEASGLGEGPRASGILGADTPASGKTAGTGSVTSDKAAPGEAVTPGGKDVSTEGTGTAPNPLAEGSEGAEDSAGSAETGKPRGRDEAARRTEAQQGNDAGFSAKEADIPEPDRAQAGRGTNTHKTEDKGFTERLTGTTAAHADRPAPAQHNKASSIELTVEPEGMGKIDIEVSVRNGEVRAEIGIERFRSLVDIQSNMPQLLDSLSKAGLTPGGFSLFLKNREGRTWMRSQYGRRETEGIETSESVQIQKHGRAGLYTVSIRV